MFNSVSEILISSGVIVTALTGVFNLITLKNNDKTLKAIEQQKFKNELVQYRCIQLHTYLKDISTRENITYDVADKEKTRITIEKATERFHVVEKEYRSIKPLLSKKYSKNLDGALNKVTEMSNAMVANIYNEEEIDFTLIDLIQNRIKFEKDVLHYIQCQLQDLISD